MAGSVTEGLYDFLQGILTQPEFSTPVGPPPPKRHRLVPTDTILTPPTQEHKATQESKATALDPLVQELEGACWSKGTPP